ncbi:MAG: hypothetical protein EBU93_00205 [Chlamydiae bacterium]|nr:hypothetical protein [Chlamydiota bacterium]
MNKYFLSIGISCLIGNFSYSTPVDKIIAYYQIQDFEGALKLIEKENDSTYQNLKLEILSKLGMTQAALEEMKGNKDLFDLRKKENFLSLESLAWSILLNPKNQSENVQVAALIGAYLTRDAKAALLLKKNLYSTNARLRSLSASFASQYQDPFLKEALLKKVKEEKNTEVKKELISSLGKMKVKEIVPYLEEILLSHSQPDEIKAQALMAFVEIFEAINLKQIQFFLKGERAHFKIIGVRLLLGYEKITLEMLKEVEPLLKDSSPEVIQEALIFIGLLANEMEMSKEIIDQINHLVESNFPYVSLCALFAKSRIEKKPDFRIKNYFSHPFEEVRNLSIVLTACLGPQGAEVLKELIFHKDPYVRINAAIGLLTHGIDIKKAILILENELQDPHRLMMIDSTFHPNFQYISSSKARHHPFIFAFPKVLDGMARLKIIEKIAIYDRKKIKDSIKKLLSEKEAVLVFYTLSLILQEDLENFEEMKELIKDSNPSIAMAATLALAFIGKEEDIGQNLIKLFDEVTFEEKLHILEAIGALGNKEMIPFLVSILQKPFSSLQIVAASALIQCLYH